MDKVGFYSAIVTIFGVVVSLAAFAFFAGETFGAMRRRFNDLQVDTIRGRRWQKTGEFLERHDNNEIMTLSILQMKFFMLFWWIFLFLALSCIGWLVFIIRFSELYVNVISSRSEGDPIDIIVALPVLSLILFIVFGFFVPGYKRRLLDQASDMLLRQPRGTADGP